MELRMLPAVVPSNGPPPSDQVTDSGIPQGPSCEGSDDEYHWDGGYELRCSEANGTQCQAHFETHNVQPVPSSYRQVVPSSQRSRTGSWRARDSLSKEKEARALFHELSKCEEYQKYRNRQPKGPQRQKDQKWPDNLEEAFFLALIFIPPMGRNKETVRPNEKPQGRNELIADYIHRLTGEPRCRKQVSSHIQVLKPLIKHNPRILQYFSKSAASKNRLHHQPFSSHASVVQNARAGPRHPMQDAPGFPNGSVQRTRFEEPQYSKPLSPSRFEMLVQVKTHETASPEPWHMITEFRRMSRRPDVYLGDVKQWSDSFPQLALMHTKSPLSCHIFSFEASLDIIPDQVPKGAACTIFLDYTGSIENLPPCSFVSRTRYFENGTPLKFEHDGELTEAVNAPVEYDSADSQILGNVRFGSTFWARKLHELAQTLRGQPGHRLPTPQDDCSDDSKETMSAHVQARIAQEHVEAALQNLSAVQEIFAYPHNNPDDVQLVLVSLWRFRKTRSGEHPFSTWRRLVAPTQQPQQYCDDKLGYASGLLSPQQSFKCPEQWDLSAEMLTEMNQTFDASVALSLDQDASPELQHPRTLRSPIDLDSHVSLIGLPGQANFQDPLAALSNFPYPILAQNGNEDYDYGFSTTSSAVNGGACGNSIDSALSAVGSGPSTDSRANTIDFGGGQIHLSFDISEPSNPGLGNVNALSNEELQIYGPQDGLETSLPSLEMGPMEAIADTDIAAPCPVQFTSEQMQEYARRWGELNGSVYGNTENYDAYNDMNAGHSQADIGAEALDDGTGKLDPAGQTQNAGYNG